MAHHEGEPTAIGHVLEVLTEHGLGAMAEAMETLMNEAMRLERAAFLGAAPASVRASALATPTVSRTRRSGAGSGSSRCGFRRFGRCRTGSRSGSTRSRSSGDFAANEP
jgi:hypothetical protein